MIKKYENLKVDIKMYMSEISKFKISDLKAQKMIILSTMKHVSAIRKHPVICFSSSTYLFSFVHLICFSVLLNVVLLLQILFLCQKCGYPQSIHPIFHSQKIYS